MNNAIRHADKTRTTVREAQPPSTLGCWFYFGFFYASPAMLVELESCMT
jgi:hypothetical protein